MPQHPAPQKIKLFIGYAGLPSFTSFLNGQKVLNTALDLGYYGTLSFDHSIYHKQKPSAIKNLKTGKGLFSDGLSSVIDTTLYYEGVVNQFHSGTFSVSGVPVNFEKGAASVAEVGLWKKYNLLLNWKEKEASVYPFQEVAFHSPSPGFGFGVSIRNQAILVSSTENESVAAPSGLQVGDEILSINQIDLLGIQVNELCTILNEDEIWSGKSYLSLKIKRVDRTKHAIELYKNE